MSGSARTVIAGAFSLVLIAFNAGCGSPTRHVKPPQPPTVETAATSEAPPPSTSTPALWPSAVVFAMPPDMVAKYTTRLADSNSDKTDRSFYYVADSLDELPVYICLILTANGPNSDQRFAWGASGASESGGGDVISRTQQYAADTGKKIEAQANWHLINGEEDQYVDLFAMDDDALVDLSLDHFCPEMRSTWDSVRPTVREIADAEAAKKAEDEHNASHPMTVFDDGVYTVGSQPGMVQPGTYRIAGHLMDCYWERSTPNGSIIANAFITNAPSGTQVRVASDEGFTSRNCTASGSRWQRVSSQLSPLGHIPDDEPGEGS